MTNVQAQKARRARALRAAIMVVGGKSRRAVAADLGVSRQYVQQLLKQAIPVIEAAL